jgi:hypothetical protein
VCVMIATQDTLLNCKPCTMVSLKTLELSQHCQALPWHCLYEKQVMSAGSKLLSVLGAHLHWQESSCLLQPATVLAYAKPNLLHRLLKQPHKLHKQQLG